MPTITEKQLRDSVFNRIKSVMLDIWPTAHVELFSSYSTGLNLPNSDLDITVLGISDPMPLRTLESNLMIRNITEPNSIFVFDKARVPIVTFTDRESKIRFDVSFNIDNGWQRRDLINEYTHKYSMLPRLVRVVKLFLMQQDLKHTYKGRQIAHKY